MAKERAETIIILEECQTCDGTGLYVTDEEKGIAAVCIKCSGTGKLVHNHTIVPFTGRKERDDIRLVFQLNPEECTPIREALPYHEFLAGHTLPQMRSTFCPRFWSNFIGGGTWMREECPMMITSQLQCPYSANMEECWRIFDESQRKDPTPGK